jgi:glycosyltransferase involved in cell wall biosynthesis
MPCLNEAETIAFCIKRAQLLLEKNGIDGEILISDNGSDDGSREISRSLGARVIDCPTRGYGAALQFGIEHAHGKFILMGDSDDSYHFDQAMPMVQQLRNGFDVCMGTRLKGTIMPKAMPKLNRYLGNPLLTGIGKIFFKMSQSDFHCGMRAFRKDKILALNLVTTGMEWASEMLIKARLTGLKITEVPITLFRDGRTRPPHLKRWQDGWRHLRFMLLHSPKWLFIIPGLMMITVGYLGEASLSRGILEIRKVYFDIQTLLVSAFVLLLGIQITFAGVFASVYSRLAGILPYDAKFDRALKLLTLEKLLLISVVVGAMGLGGFLHTLWGWHNAHFSELNPRVTMRQLVPALTMVAISVQGVFNGFMLSVLFLKTRPDVMPTATATPLVETTLTLEESR